MGIDDVGQGLATAFVIDYVEKESKRGVLIAVAIAVVSVVLVIVAPTWLKIIAGVSLATALIVAATLFLLSWGVIKAVRRIAEPRNLGSHRAALSATIDEADLPTGPIKARRCAWRLRKGTGPEFERLRSIAVDLADDLDPAD